MCPTSTFSDRLLVPLTPCLNLPLKPLLQVCQSCLFWISLFSFANLQSVAETGRAVFRSAVRAQSGWWGYSKVKDSGEDLMTAPHTWTGPTCAFTWLPFQISHKRRQVFESASTEDVLVPAEDMISLPQKVTCQPRSLPTHPASMWVLLKAEDNRYWFTFSCHSWLFSNQGITMWCHVSVWRAKHSLRAVEQGFLLSVFFLFCFKQKRDS